MPTLDVVGSSLRQGGWMGGRGGGVGGWVGVGVGGGGGRRIYHCDWFNSL